uniref:Uncharacterized protein n=1 Tax=Anguilla anguilla TaxID=7936 RepID=A0A0E9TEI8_ANGAN
MHLKALYSVRPVTHLNNHQCLENAQIFTVQQFYFSAETNRTPIITPAAVRATVAAALWY